MSSQDDELFLHLDVDRRQRCGFPEVVYGASKTTAEIVAAAAGIHAAAGIALVTRCSPEAVSALQAAHPEAQVWERSGTVLIGATEADAGPVAVVSAGTSDASVAEEAEATLIARGVQVRRIADCGVAGLHRLLGRLPEIRSCVAIVAVAGMDAALPTVLGGLIDIPMIAVPTSVGYGVATGGQTALHSILASCAPGVTCVNIDNGFGGGNAAATIARQLCRNPAAEG